MSQAKVSYCTFCGKSMFDVFKLIACPEAMICNECVEICVDIIEQARKPTAADLEYDSWLK